MSKFKAEFEQLEVLGRGGFGIVYKVRHRLLECMYAVKAVVLPDDAARAESVLREVRTLARMQHPNIVRFYACWVEDGLPDDAMDIPRHLDGSTAGASKRSCIIFESAEVAGEPKDGLAMPTLTETEEITATQTVTVTHGRRLVGSWKVLYMQMELCLGTINPYLTTDYDAPVRMALFGQLLRGVGYLHQNGIVHNDLKPSNLLMHHQHLKIADFGLITDSTLPAAFRGGTPLYVPPETSRGTASDVFSLGIIFVEFLCAPLIDRERILKRVRCGEIPTNEYPVLIPYKDLILTMVSNNPTERPNVAQLQQLLRVIGMPAALLSSEPSVSGGANSSSHSQHSSGGDAQSQGTSQQGTSQAFSQGTSQQAFSQGTSQGNPNSAGRAPSSTGQAAQGGGGVLSAGQLLATYELSPPASQTSAPASEFRGFSQSQLIADLEAQLEQLRTANVLYAEKAAQACDARDNLQKQHNSLVDQHKNQQAQQAEMQAQIKALHIDHTAAIERQAKTIPSREPTREASLSGVSGVSNEPQRRDDRPKRSRAEMQQMVGFVPDAAFITDPSGIILCCNREVTEDFEYGGEELEGKHINTILPASLGNNADSLNTLLTSTAASRKANMRSLTKSGKQLKSAVQCKKPKGQDDLLVFIVHT